VHQPTKTIYGGRFRLEVPIEFALTGEGGFMNDVELIGVTLPAAPSLAAARDAFWKGHLADVRRQTRMHELPPILGEGELRPGVPELVYLGYTQDDLAHEALLTEPGRGVIVKALWRQNYKPEDRPADNAERLRAFHEVVNAFSFLPPDYAAADRDAYYINEGMARIAYTVSSKRHPEHYEIGFDGKTQGMEFSFEYQLPDVAGRDRPSLVDRVAQAVAEWASVGRTVRSGHRVVAGFSGQESVIQTSDGHSVGFTWIYEPAAAAQGFQPAITIDGQSKDGDVHAVLALWDQILDGVQRLVP
jgi:hypothetical protein